MKAYLLIILADILLAVNFSLQKRYQEKMGIGAYAGLFFNAVLGLFTALVFGVGNGFMINFSMYSIIMIIIMSVLSSVYMIIGFRILRSGNMSFYTLFLMTGGMTVPYVWGVIFLKEQINLMRVVGMIFIILSIVLSNLSKVKSDKKLISLCCVVFFLNGFVSVISKMHQISTTYETVSTMDFMFWSGLVNFIICGVALMLLKRNHTDTKQIDIKSIMPIIFLSAIVNGLSFVCQLIGAISIPASVLYPLVTGGTIIFSTITGCVIFKEKLSIRQWISVGICFVGTCLFL